MKLNEVYKADVFDKLPEFDNNSIEAVVTDPPYNLKFMGKSWDDKGGPKEFQEWNERWASIAYDKLKPGGYMIVFSGTKTYHRMVSGVEDAGFEIKDMIEWMYGTGFPKSYNIGKNIKSDNWQGWGTALKPAHEPLILVQKPREGTYCNNIKKYACGGLNIDECRAKTNDSLNGGATNSENAVVDEGDFNRPWMHNEEKIKEHQEKMKKKVKHAESLGRFPANLILSHHPDCEYQGSKRIESGPSPDQASNAKAKSKYRPEQGDYQAQGPLYADEDGKETVEDWDCIPSCPVRAMNEQSGELHPSGNKNKNLTEEGDSVFGIGIHGISQTTDYKDKGGAARYFNQFHFRDEDFFKYTAKASKSERTCDGNVDNDHPTVKPLELMKWLIRLITPSEGIVVDPFCGSGTTLIAAYEQDFNFIGIDRDERAVEIAKKRLEYHRKDRQERLF